MSEEVKDTRYRPRTKYHEAIHQSLKRFNVLVCHRGFGKTHLTIGECLDRGIRNNSLNPQYAYIAPNYGQAKRVAWDVIKHYAHNLPNFKSNEQDLTINFARPVFDDKLKFFLLGSENPGSIRGIHLDGVVIDEFAECDPIIWTQVINPALRQKRGWVIFIGTPKGMNHFYDILQVAKGHEDDWFWCVYKASQTGLISKKELEQARQVMAPEEFDQEFECSFSAALIGAYYGRQMEDVESSDRICNVDYDPNVPVDTFWDLGIGDSTAIWFAQEVGKEIHLIDYMEYSGKGLEIYVKEILAKKYVYRDHILPHDAAAKELGTGRTRQETLRNLGLRNTIILKKFGLEDGINAARMLLPMCWFDRKNCQQGINALKNYESKWDTKNKIFQARPKHNWASHGADAFRYLALGLRRESDRLRSVNLPRSADNVYDIFGG